MAAVQSVALTLDTMGWSVDILVSNAGNQNRKPLVEMSREEWQKIQDVHVGGAFNCSRVFLPGLQQREGFENFSRQEVPQAR